MSTFDKNFLTNLENQPYLVSLLPRLKEERTQSFATLAFTLIAIAIFGFFAINPTLATIADLQKQLDDSKFVDSQLSKKISALTSLQGKYNQMQSDVPVVLNAIPTSAYITNFVAQVQTIGDNNNMQIINIQTYPVDISSLIAPITTYSSFAFTLDALGNPTDISHFLTGMSSFNRLVTLDNISLNQTLQGSTSLRLNLKGKVYFKR